MSLKEKVKSYKHANGLIYRAIYQFLRPFWQLKRFFTDDSFRAMYLARRKFKDSYLQRPVSTRHNRYPLVFDACRKYLSNRSNLNILSYGCSTGEEVFTLGEYLPGATITGVDINEWCISECLKKNTNPNYRFFHRYSLTFTDAGDFDAIFCMAVFQRTENRMDTNNQKAKRLTFERFEQEISMLDKKLKPGGLLAIDNADFSFIDTACSEHYKPLEFEKNKLTRNRPSFDKNNVKISETQSNYRVFVKHQ